MKNDENFMPAVVIVNAWFPLSLVTTLFHVTSKCRHTKIYVTSHRMSSALYSLRHFFPSPLLHSSFLHFLFILKIVHAKLVIGYFANLISNQEILKIRAFKIFSSSSVEFIMSFSYMQHVKLFEEYYAKHVLRTAHVRNFKYTYIYFTLQFRVFIVRHSSLINVWRPWQHRKGMVAFEAEILPCR